MSSQPYIVSARKYRPATFNTVVGQKALTATLKNAILGKKLSQAYLFCGPRGVGKTSCARIFAKTINCLHPTPDGEACGQCESCLAIDKGNSFNLIELDAASNNSVDDIRDITDQVNIPAQDGRYRVFIIDEVHMLSNSAFNAFLKTLEEPPKNVVFILATTERHKVIPTILSRCQVYDFRRITVNDIIDHLQYVAQQEGVEADRESLGVIALKADGAMRDALSIFDQVVASTGGHLTYQGTIDALNVLDQDYYFRLVDIFKRGEVAEALLTFKEIVDKGFDPQFFINGLASHVRNLMVSADPRTVSLLETSEEWNRKYSEQAPQLPVEWYYDAIKILNDADFNYRTSGNKRLLVELTLIRLSRLLNPGLSYLNQQASAPPPASAASQASQTPVTKPTAVAESSPSSPKASSPRSAEPQSPNYGSAPFVKPDGPKPQSVPAQPPTEARRKGNERPKSFRLNAASVSGRANAIDKRKTTFTADALNQAWEDYMTTHPDQRILVSAMRSWSPRIEKDEIINVDVDHPAQKQAFESNMADLLEFLKDKLSNDFITLRVEINEKGSSDQSMSPKDFLKLVVDENETLADFLKSIEAELQ